MHPSATVYFGTESHSVMIASMHVNQDGIGYEQEQVRVLPAGYSFTELGDALKQALSNFCQRPCDLRARKKTDWPAFRASGLSSVARFQREFLPVSVGFLNASGALARAEVALSEEEGIGICCTFNPRSSSEDLGRGMTELLRVFERASKAEPAAGGNAE